MLYIYSSENVIKRLLCDGKSGIVTPRYYLEKLFGVGGRVEPYDAGPRRHDLIDAAITQPEDSLKHFPFGVLQSAFADGLVDESFDFFLRHLGLRGKPCGNEMENQFRGHAKEADSRATNESDPTHGRSNDYGDSFRGTKRQSLWHQFTD